MFPCDSLPSVTLEGEMWMKLAVAAIGLLLCLSGNQLSAAQSGGPKTSLATLQKRADAGDAGAQTDMGIRYRSGDGVAKDEARAIEWYRRAAKQGYARAYFLLGTAFYNGDGIASNEEIACKWFLLASEAGEPNGKAAYEREKTEAQPASLQKCEILAGDAYVNGEELPADASKGLKVYTQAAEAGSGVAALRLAHLYKTGVGTHADAASATHWLEVAMKAREREAVLPLGKAFETGDGVPVDLHRACELYLQGARQNMMDSVVALGDLLRDGKGVDKNLRQAVLLYRQAANFGNSAADARLKEVLPQLSKKELKQLRESNGYSVEFPRCR